MAQRLKKIMKDYRINEIEALTEQEVQEMAHDSKSYKSYNCYFVNLGEWFGDSVIVFKNGRQIEHANDYQLHHSRLSSEELRAQYERHLAFNLFNVEDMQKIESYEDYKAKRDYIVNVKPYEFDYISCFTTDNVYKKEDMFFSGACFGYFANKEDAEEVNALNKALQDARAKKLKTIKFLTEAFKYEIANHEYCYNMQANWDVFSAVFNKNLTYKGDEMFGDEERADYIRQLGLEDMADKITKAFDRAKNHYYKVTDF